MAKKASKVAVKNAEKGKKAASAVPAKQAPAHPLTTLRQDIERAFDRISGEWPDWGLFSGRPFEFRPLWDLRAPPSLQKFDLAPSADVGETDKGFEITVELPGLEEKDLDVTVSEGMLVLKGEKQSEREEKGKEYHLTERSYGSFRRAFRLPDNVNSDKIEATFQKGVLTILVPKTASAKSKARKVAIASK